MKNNENNQKIIRKYDQNGNELAIRFGLGATKAVGIGAVEEMMLNRTNNGEFKDIYDFSSRMGSKIINKKLVEALAKSGSFDNIHKNRRQIFESCEVINKYASAQEEQNNSNQMNLFGGSNESVINTKPALAAVEDWDRNEKLQKEFEAFDFFLNQHPIDDFINDLEKRGVTFSKIVEEDEIKDGYIIKMAGVVAYSKHKSGPKGRYAYLTMSDHIGIFETSIFDEELITNSRDLMADGKSLVVECLVRKNEGGTRLLVKKIESLENFIKNNQARSEAYRDIRKSQEKGNNGGEIDWRAKKWAEKQQFKKQNPIDPLVAQANWQKQIDKLKSKQVISNVNIEINGREAVLNLKSFLSQKLAPQEIGFEKFSKVFFWIKNGENKTKIELNDNYLLDESDINKISQIKDCFILNNS